MLFLLLITIIASAHGILYGNDIEVSKVPSFVKVEIKSIELFQSKSSLCGGVYIHRKFVLTAAYCLVNSRKPLEIIDYYRIELGMGMSTLKDDPDQQTRDCVSYAIHEKYLEEKTFAIYNIALIEINEPFDLNANVKIGTLAPKSPNLNSYFKVFIAGFGYREVNNYYSPTLKGVTVSAKLRGDKKTFVVSKDKQKGAICVGDFGGPMYYNGKVIGIASHFGTKKNFFWKDCFIRDGQFTNIFSFKSWIKENIETEAEESRRRKRRMSNQNNISSQLKQFGLLNIMVLFLLLF